MLKNKAGVWVGLILCILSLVFFLISLNYDYRSALGPGPGLLPRWVSGMLFILSLLYIYDSIKKDKNEEFSQEKEGFKKVLAVLIPMILFIGLVSFLGFVVTSILFLYSLLYREYRWYQSLGISFGVSLFIFWLFGSVLHVALPVNGFGW